jgi:ribosomal protein S18 acetylase RimI-like enzyme
MGILPEFHRRGIGRRLVTRFEEILLADGVRWLQVKTLSPSRENEEYRRTREFYVRLGFEPLEEFKTLWGEANPCLQMVKRLGIPGAPRLKNSTDGMLSEGVSR